MARDRARRNPISRAAYAPAYKLAETKPGTDIAPRDDTPAVAAPRSRRTRILLIAMLVALGVNFGAVVGVAGWNVLQALGVIAPPAIEAVQREQGDAIAKLDSTVDALNTAMSGLTTRADSLASEQAATSRRVADMEAGFGELRASIDDMRVAKTDAAAATGEAWREPVAEVTATATRARSEMIRLRASLHELAAPREQELAAMGARIDRLEQAMARRKLLGAMRGSIAEPTAAVARPAAAHAPAGDGHIINLAPAE